MTRSKLRIVVDGEGGPRARLLEALREMGYTVTADEVQLRQGATAAEVLVPYGEVDARPAYLGKPRTTPTSIPSGGTRRQDKRRHA